MPAAERESVLGILLEFAASAFFPMVLLASYLYLVLLKKWLEEGGEAFRWAAVTGIFLLWVAAFPGPVVLLGALAVSLALFIISWVPARPTLKKPKLPSKDEIKACNGVGACVVRYLMVWPALAALASTLHPFVSPLVMFALGLILKPKSTLNVPEKLQIINKVIVVVVVLAAWGFAVMNTLKNLLLPQWLLVQNYALSGEVSKLPLTARLMAKLFGKEAAYLYLALVVLLALYTVVRLNQVLPMSKFKYAMVIISPFVGYAVSSNKLGEPLTSIAYAVGISISATLKVNLDSNKAQALVNKVVLIIEKLGEKVLLLDLPTPNLRRLTPWRRNR